jgi:NAD(P)-dependent dehydrogenase (short-subunit alcohol dehydrogenase family)
MNFSLKGQVAIVTGGSRGIGEAVAVALAEAGADIAIASRKLPDLEAAAEKIRRTGAKCLIVPTHIGRLDDISNLVARVVAEYGRIDILVNNAATNPTVAAAIDVDERAWDAVMNLNLKGLFFLSQAVAKIMKEKGGGKIINIASVAAFSPDVLPVYSISKAAVVMATKVMAQQWGQYNIRANAVAPGLTKTRFSEFLWSNPEVAGVAIGKNPIPRVADPEDMAGAVIYLASDASRHVTGHTIIVDGGSTI